MGPRVSHRTRTVTTKPSLGSTTPNTNSTSASVYYRTHQNFHVYSILAPHTKITHSDKPPSTPEASCPALPRAIPQITANAHICINSIASSRAVESLDGLQRRLQDGWHCRHPYQRIVSPTRSHKPRARLGDKILRGGSQNRLPVHLNVSGEGLSEAPTCCRHQSIEHDIPTRRATATEGAEVDPVVE